MPRYVQMRNQAGEWELIEVEDRPRGQPRLQIMGAKARESYKSPIDGSIITSERKEREHMRQHNVVRPGDFGADEGREFFDRARQKRQDFYDGKDQEHKREVRNDIIDTIHKVNQGMPITKPGEE